MQTNPKWRLVGVGLIAASLVLVLVNSFHAAKGADATAIWMAGRAFAAGQVDQIYVSGQGVFSMRPPAEWQVQLEAMGASDLPIYPFVYPPLWAWVSGLIFPADLSTFTTLLVLCNAGFLLAMVWLGWRIAGGDITPMAGLSVAICVTASLPVALGVVEMQPQLFVTFLLLLALERHLAGADRFSGALIALAASIKLFPALFVLMLVARRRWQGVGAFVLVGGGLGLASIAVAGWPMHQTFLSVLGEISDTVLLTGASPSLNAGLANILTFDQMTYQPATVANETMEPPRLGWYYMARPSVWGAVQGLVTLVTLGGVIWMTARATGRAPVAACWASLSLVIVLLAPISWFYYLIFATFLLPLLFTELPRNVALGIVLAGAALMSPAALHVGFGLSRFPFVMSGVVAVALWLVGFAIISWPGRNSPRSPHAEHS